MPSVDHTHLAVDATWSASGLLHYLDPLISSLVIDDEYLVPVFALAYLVYIMGSGMDSIWPVCVE